MPSDRDTLMSMGFEAARVDWALKATGGRGLQPAMDHILENEGTAVPEMSGAAESTAPASNVMDVDDDEDAQMAANLAEAKSIKCSECGKVFKNTALANFHAEKSGHQAFEESTEELKPLTEEEKKAKLEELRAKMAEKRNRKAIEEAAANKANENIRRKQGKDLNQIKEDLKVKEALKEAEQRKRDKIEDAKARAAIKAQIEADKKARNAKFAREKAIRDGQPIPDLYASSSTPAPVAAPAASTNTGVKGRDFKETRLQIRMASGGQPYTTTLSSDAPLREVAEYLAGQSLNVDVDTVQFSQQFPRKIFTSADMDKSLRTLELTPSAVLIATTP